MAAPRSVAPHLRIVRFLALFTIFLLSCTTPAPPNIPRTGLIFLGEAFWLAPGSIGSFIVQVTDPNTGEPLADSQVEVSLGVQDGETTSVFTGISDEQGLVRVSFDVPEEVTDPNQRLFVEATTRDRTRVHTEEVYVGRAYNILVSTDKPVYQPGQVIHIRALALDSLALTPANDQPLTVTVTDPAGNKVMHRELTTSEYGVTSVDFPVDTLAASGDYVITAEMGPVESTRTVEVKPYQLPRFKVEFAPDQRFYLPGETATGEVRAHYFFGKPVAEGDVTLQAFVTDVDRVQVFELNGATNADGVFEFEFAVPDYFVGQLDNQSADLDLEITVTDAADHSESIDESITVAEQTLLIEAIPESGSLRPGLDNIVYLDVTYPDGRAVTATVEIASPMISDTIDLTTDENGLAAFQLTPPSGATSSIVVTATTATGESTVQPLVLDAASGAEAILLRPERAEYQIGETINLDILVGGNARTVYLDVIKGRQSFALLPLPITDGIAQAAIDVDGSLLGTLELNAYVVSDRGEILHDRRLVLVNPAPAQVDVTLDADTYRPGETATIALEVNRDGAAMPGVLGVSIVDESVYSVETQDAGFARTYFLLERNLQEPRYEIHDFSDLDADEPSPYDDNPESYRIGHVQGWQDQGWQDQSGLEQANASSLAQARNFALMGLFAQELAAMPPAASMSGSANPTPNPIHASLWGWLARMPLMLPLVGVALYNGTQRRRKMLLGLLLLALASGVYSACASASPAAAPASSDGEGPAPSSTTRLRQYFPETLYWQPALETDAEGRAVLEIPVADSITTWRINVLASDLEGHLGSAEAPLHVFQEFFVEPDLPRFLTVGDELDVPISIFNYLDQPQTIDLSVTPAPWFELREPGTLQVTLAPNEVRAAYIPIRVLEFGEHPFQVIANGPIASDAVQRTVEVLPDGAPRTDVASGSLKSNQRIPINVPVNAVAGASYVSVRLYPGIVAQAVAGLEGMLREPYGCFEQTSSISYPNTLILDYLRATEQVNPDLELRADYLVNLGYQRLLTFEVPGYPGGYSLFGDPLPEVMLTAFGLMQFADIERVSYVDPAVITRMADFLMSYQQANGAWGNGGMFVEIANRQPNDGGDIPTTAYMVWALADAGYADSSAVARGIEFLDNAFVQSESDPYVLAMVANAYIAADRPAMPLTNRLAEMAQPTEGDAVAWNTDATTWLTSHGPVANLETTAMATMALLRSRQHLDLAEGGLAYITGSLNGSGAYPTTQTTVLSLKALLLAAEMGGESGEGTVTISLNNGATHVIEFSDTASDVVHEVTFDDLAVGPGELSIDVAGDKSIQYQVNTHYVLPWESTRRPTAETAPIRIDVDYDRQELQQNDTVGVRARVQNATAANIGTLLVDLGVAPGFTPLTADLDALVEAGVVDRYELTGRQIIFYLSNVTAGEVRDLSYRLQARFPIRGQTPPSSAYNYYAPEQKAIEPPQRVNVTLGTPD